jgi:hypothetical protein
LQRINLTGEKSKIQNARSLFKIGKVHGQGQYQNWAMLNCHLTQAGPCFDSVVPYFGNALARHFTLRVIFEAPMLPFGISSF